jgi:hypothetical protein
MSTYVQPMATYQGNQTSRVYDISDRIMLLSTFRPVVWDLAMSQGYTSSTDVRFQWDEKDYSTIVTAVNNSGGYNTSATDIVVDDASIYTAKDFVRVIRTGEVMQITTVTVGTNTLTVVRGVGNSGTGIAINDNDTLIKSGAGFEEGSTYPSTRMNDTSTVYNYCQTFRWTYGVTGTEARTRSTPGQRFSVLDTQNAGEFTRLIEEAAIFGKRDQNTAAFSKYRHATGGLLYYVTTNTTAVGGTLSLAAWLTFLTDKAFKYGSNRKYFFCGSLFQKILATFGFSYYRTDMGEGRLGFPVLVYITPTGKELVMVEHELFKTTSDLSGLGIVVDPESIEARYTENPYGAPEGIVYPNGRVQWRPNINPQGTDAVTREYFAEIGFVVRDEQKCAVISGVTGAA